VRNTAIGRGPDVGLINGRKRRFAAGVARFGKRPGSVIARSHAARLLGTRKEFVLVRNARQGDPVPEEVRWLPAASESVSREAPKGALIGS
jgi:hypothetical protein